MKKKGSNSVVLTTIIVFVSASIMAGWSWHSIPGYELSAGNHVAEQAYYEKQSGLMVEVSGQVVRVLGSGENGDALQWFQMRTPVGQRLTVAHDGGLSDPIPLSPRDDVVVRGLYEWTESGGTIRNTERDFSLARQHGWIEHDGRKYD